MSPTIRPELLAAGNRKQEQWRSDLVERCSGLGLDSVPLGLLLYDGPSLIDGAPILAVLTGFQQPSRNAKTGDLLQAYILPSKVHPTRAVNRGADVSVCGTCPHRPSQGGRCYVQTSFGAAGVWRSRERYLKVKDEVLQVLLRGAAVRFGAWGDPAAVPLHAWLPLLAPGVLRLFTGYTHRWKELGENWQWLMASVDSVEEFTQAREAGWRTYRVKAPGAPLLPGEQTCLADAHGVPCVKCGGCDGTARYGVYERVSYAIDVHGFREAKAPQLHLMFGA